MLVLSQQSQNNINCCCRKHVINIPNPFGIRPRLPVCREGSNDGFICVGDVLNIDICPRWDSSGDNRNVESEGEALPAVQVIHMRTHTRATILEGKCGNVVELLLLLS